MIQRPAYHSFHPAPAVGPHQFPQHSTLLHSAPDLPLHSVPLPGSLVPPCPETTLLPFHLANDHQVSDDHHLLSEVFDNPTAPILPQKRLHSPGACSHGTWYFHMAPYTFLII